MHECFPKHSSMGTARMKLDKETDKEGKMRGVSIEKSKSDTKKKSRRPNYSSAYHPPGSLRPEAVNELSKKPTQHQ